MTAPDYVSQAAELLGKHRVRGFSHRDECACGWQIPDRAGWADRRSHDAHVAEVLASAGLIPTRTEWAVRHPTLGPEARTIEPEHRALYGDHWTILARPAHDWKDAT